MRISVEKAAPENRLCANKHAHLTEFCPEYKTYNPQREGQKFNWPARIGFYLPHGSHVTRHAEMLAFAIHLRFPRYLSGPLILVMGLQFKIFCGRYSQRSFQKWKWDRCRTFGMEKLDIPRQQVQVFFACLNIWREWIDNNICITNLTPNYCILWVPWLYCSITYIPSWVVETSRSHPYRSIHFVLLIS